MDDELNRIIPLDPYEPYSMHQVIHHVVDRGTFLEIQPVGLRMPSLDWRRIGGH